MRNDAEKLEMMRKDLAPRRAVAASDAHMASQTGAAWTSSNWSGYALASSQQGAYESVSATWTVPSVQTQSPSPTPTPPPSWTWWQQLLDELLALFGSSNQEASKAISILKGHMQSLQAAGHNAPHAAASGNSYSATWIGIDGFNDSNLIQTGTAQNLVGGQPQYYAWWEILPAAETQLDSSAYPVQPGDNMQANIAKQTNGTWNIVLQNTSAGWTFTKQNIRYSGPGTSVEWIEEAPEVNGQITTLAPYGTVTFTHCMVNGSPAALTASDRGVMVQNGQQLSTPSDPGTSGDDFTVAYGANQPVPPTA